MTTITQAGTSQLTGFTDINRLPVLQFGTSGPLANGVANSLNVSTTAILGAIAEEFDSGIGATPSFANSFLDYYVGGRKSRWTI